MRFVELTLTSGGTVHVNLARVLSIRERPEGSALERPDSLPILVKETPEEILNRDR